jgi:subtilisin
MSANISAKTVDSKRPQYLVVFREPSEKNADTLSTVLKRGKSPTAFESAGVSFLAAANTGVETKVYHPLGIAAADLSDTQINTLRKRDDVEAIVENEVRSLPPIRRSIKQMETKAGSERKSDMLAYLHGLRDAITLAIAYHEGGKQVETTGPNISLATTVPAAVSDTTWGLKAIGVATAFPPPTGRGVKVAVLDTGLDLNHPDFKNRVVEGVTARSFVTGISVQDVHGHGTHCAGTICGPRDSIGGIRYGVAPEAELLVGKVFNNAIRPKATDDDILEGITWAEDNGARIISMSLGSSRGTGADFPLQYEAVARSLLNRSTNSVLLVAAAGNASDRPSAVICVENPAACPSIMAVAAVDIQRRIASFSCKQLDEIGAIDVAAPGVGVYSSVTGGTFEEFDGTSMAAPHVTGLAALYLERNPGMTARQLFDELKNRALALGDLADFGSGLIQL